MNDPVNHPAHYTTGKIEVMDFIEDKNLNFALGNTVKYIARCGHKVDAGMTLAAKELEDLKKAAWYLSREIKTRTRALQNAQKEDDQSAAD